MKVGAIATTYFNGHKNLTEGARGHADDLTLAQLLDKMLIHRVPSNVETADFTVATNDTWEDKDLIALINAQLTTKIRTGEAVMLRGTLEFINGEAAINSFKWGDGGTPDNDDTVNQFYTKDVQGSEFINVDVITDGDGKIKIECSDKAKLTAKFHLKSFQYVKKAAIS